MTRAAVALIAAAVVAAGAAPRIALAAGVLPGWLRPFVWSDVLNTWARSGGAVPYWSAPFEYPPLTGYLAGALTLVAGSVTMYVALWAALSALGAAAVALLVARAAGVARAALYWSLSPQLLLYGTMNFDVIAVAALVAAVLLARGGRPLLAFAALSAGALVKLFPAFVAPLEAARLVRDHRPRPASLGLGVFIALSVIVAAPSLVAPWPSTSGLLYVGGLTNFDSVWGLVLAALDGLGIAGTATIASFASATGMLVTYVVVLRRVRQGDGAARVALLGLLAVLLWSRLYSPQYSLWVLPFIALLDLPRRVFALLCLADVLVFATVYPLTLVAWAPADALASLLFAVLALGIVLRHVALLAVWRSAWSRPATTR